MKLTFLDKFGDFLLGTKIVELASERQENISKIKEISDILIYHLFKIYLMPKSIHKNHWLDEIDSFFSKIDKLYWGKNKYSSTDYFNWIFVYFFYGNIEDYYSNLESNIKNKLEKNFKKISDKYLNEYQINYSFNEFKNITERFIKMISIELEKKRNGYPIINIEKVIEDYYIF